VLAERLDRDGVLGMVLEAGGGVMTDLQHYPTPWKNQAGL
jgi:hypothetical protein